MVLSYAVMQGPCALLQTNPGVDDISSAVDHGRTRSLTAVHLAPNPELP